MEHKTLLDILPELVPVLLALVSLVHSIYAAGRTHELKKEIMVEKADRENGPKAS